MVSGEKNIVSDPSEKSAVTTLLLFLFLGWLGIHRFYVGKWFTGLLMLLTLSFFGIWWLVDLAFLVSNEFTDGKGKIVELLKKPASFKVVMSIFTGFVATSIVLSIILPILPPALLSALPTALSPKLMLSFVVASEHQALSRGDIQKAYSYTASSYQKNTSIDEFASFVRAHQLDATNADVVDGAIFNSDAKIIVKITLKDGSTNLITYRFRKENGEWKIISIDAQKPVGASSNAPKSGDQ